MKRSEFLKKLGVGTAGCVLVPTLMKAETQADVNKKVELAIDVESISHFVFCGARTSPADILQIYYETGMLIYNSNHGQPPMIIKGEVEVIDFAKT